MQRTIQFGLLGLFFLAVTSDSSAQQPASFAPRGQTKPSAQTSMWDNWENVQAQAARPGEKRKTIVNIYTDWCGFCKKMEAETFTHPFVAQYMTEHFNLVKFNAEQKTEIEYKGKKYSYSRSGPRGYNEWTYMLLNGRPSFPALVFLSEDQEVIQPISGFKSPEELLPILMYFSTDEYKVKPWSAYQKTFKLPDNFSDRKNR